MVAAYILKKDFLGGYSGLSENENYFLVFFLMFLGCYVSFNFFGLYRARELRSIPNILVKVLLALGSASIFLIVSLYIFHQADISRLLLLLINSIAFVLVSLRAILTYKYLHSGSSREKNSVNILIIGSKERAKETIKTIYSAPTNLLNVVGCLELDDRRKGQDVVEGVKILGGMNSFCSLLLNEVIDEVIFAIPLKKIPNVTSYIKFAEKLGIRIRIMPDWQLQKIMFRPETASITFDDLVGLPTLLLSSTPRKDVQLLIKNIIDYVGAGLGLLIMSPLMLIIAILIKLDSSGPVFFIQERVGVNGRHFKLYKFRTMVKNAEELKKKLEQQNEMDGPVFKIKNDPRITRIGKILRKTSLDELPQLFNVLRGEMSLVGPRPPLPNEVEKYEPHQRRRLSMKPGLTCIWQVSGRNDVDFDSWMKMDLEYIDNWSLLLDLKLIFRTMLVVLLGTGR
ncbi:Undecaprenyl-phosphate galactosephosphotransferase [Dissulfuribacter thermophilus]|uniref:Undecaprenyl-phosphate galactosephosphotransferase n=2 Tax=Dissulfuribacter thermophilus TaxID=1156395 RepID=A0A1B9F6M7_9BACT|nr:Undecaprenyl-phosphate galactosephosphotransferase [Dissulfuribacter thermophilus]